MCWWFMSSSLGADMRGKFAIGISVTIDIVANIAMSIPLLLFVLYIMASLDFPIYVVGSDG